MGEAVTGLETTASDFGFIGTSPNPVAGLFGPEAGQTIGQDIGIAAGAGPSDTATFGEFGAIGGGSQDVGQAIGTVASGPGSTAADVGAGVDATARTIGSFFIPGVGAAGDAISTGASTSGEIAGTAVDASAANALANAGFNAGEATAAGAIGAGSSLGSGGAISPTGEAALSQSTPDVVAGGMQGAGTPGQPTSGEAPADVVGGPLPGAAPATAAPAPAAAPPSSGAVVDPSTAPMIGKAADAASALNAGQAPGSVASAGPATGSTAAAPASFTDKALNALSDPGTDLKLALGGAGLGLALSSGQGRPSGTVAPAAQPLTPGGAVTAPLINTETQSLGAFNAQQLTPPQQAQIDQFIQDQTNQLYQLIANSGVTDPRQDSRFRSGMAQIQQQALVMKQQLLQQDLTAGLQSAGAAAGNLSTAAQQQLALDNEFNQALQAALSSAGNLAAGQQSIKLLSAAA